MFYIILSSLYVEHYGFIIGSAADYVNDGDLNTYYISGEDDGDATIIMLTDPQTKFNKIVVYNVQVNTIYNFQMDGATLRVFYLFRDLRRQLLWNATLHGTLSSYTFNNINWN